jgi:hypothetical protein
MSGAKMLAALRELDATLAGLGFKPLTPWWDQQLEAFYLHPTARTLVAEVGRGGIKTGTGCTVALAETLFGDFDIPPGERHFWIDLSENKDEAIKTQRLYEARLKALGVPFHRSGDVIELDDLPRGFLVRANSIGAVSGWRSYGVRADELAKWPREGAEPAAEVIASAMAMTVTHATARKLFLSSPVAKVGFFHQRVTQSTNDYQVVCHAPTWIANPSVTEEQTHLLEPDPRLWSREYAAIASDSITQIFDSVEVEVAMRPAPRGGATWYESIVPLDFSKGRGDAIVFGPAAWAHPRIGAEAYLRRDLRDERGNMIAPLGEIVTDDYGFPVLDPDFKGEVNPFLHVWDMVAFEGKFADVINFDRMADIIAWHGARWGAPQATGDQAESYALSSALPKRGMRFETYPWSNTNKGQAVERLSRLFRDRMIIVPRAEKLRTELLSFEEKVLPSGTITWEGKADDRVAMLLSAMIADINGLIKGSPIRQGRGRGSPQTYDERQAAMDGGH